MSVDPGVGSDQSVPAAHIDCLTGLPDRQAALRLVQEQVRHARSHGVPLALLWIDVDRFETVNYSVGHAGGDQLVLETARRVRNAFRDWGDLARLGADEFLLVLPGATRATSAQVAQNLLEVMLEPVPIEGFTVRRTVSIGIALLNDPNESPGDFLLRADKAKAVAKRRGGNTYAQSGEPQIDEGFSLAREELEIEALLLRAMNHRCVGLHYQPIVRIDGSLDAVEGLLRCTIDGKTIPPGQLIPVAEKTGLIHRLGAITMMEGIRTACRLRAAGLELKVAVNVSRAQLLEEDFLPDLHAALACTDLSPQFLELELTESMFLDTAAIVQRNIAGAVDCGVRLAIDDFGTGYSSLATLKDVPATKLKLDKSFIDVLPDDEKALAVVKAMTGLGHELGMTVVAEGVETEAQSRCLGEIGVDALQGYFFARPMPIEEIFKWVASTRGQIHVYI